jgi:hypothetical protein
MKNVLRDARGFSHQIVIVVLVALVGIVGSAFVVLSHADTCPTTSDVTAVSTQDCPVVSEPVSTVTALGSCSISMKPSTTPGRGVQTQFLISVTNSGTVGFTPVVNASVYNFAPSSAKRETIASSSSLTGSVLSPGQTATLTYDKAYTTPTNKAITGGYMTAASATNNPAFNCRVDFTLPRVK